jgi:2'-5' RNA ligase
MSLPFRHAAYFAPALDSQAWKLGSQWLGRCARNSTLFEQPKFKNLNSELFDDLTRTPRMYGWHATLKAPFELNSNTRLEELRTAFKQLAQNVASPIHLSLKLVEIGDFLALKPSHTSPDLQKLAEQCVRSLHAFALPLSESELQRRTGSGLTARQKELLSEWAYPFVMEQFQFHLTLTGSLQGVENQVRSNLKDAAQSWFAPLLENGVVIDSVTWFTQDQKNGNFRWVERFEFGNSNCV